MCAAAAAPPTGAAAPPTGAPPTSYDWSSYAEVLSSKKLLVVGAGGIGCELLKNMVMIGMKKITVIDLDTIDVSNLNRQFLFHRCHVGQSKALVARDAVLKYGKPGVQIEAVQANIMDPKYGVSFFQGFDLVLSALDNRAARSHVNRLCLAADVTLVESGTAGYLGQVTVMRKRATECYECTPKPHQKTFPGCTIRNTPSEPIHCIVWAKHLFNQLFGETDPDEEVSPDTADPDAAADDGDDTDAAKAGDAAKEAKKDDGSVQRQSTRQWAEEQDYDAEKLFQKLFHDDVEYLLTMAKLWSKRKPPTPMTFKQALDMDKEDKADKADKDKAVMRTQKVWTMRECAEEFKDSVDRLKKSLKQMPSGQYLIWDKDDPAAMDFVTACANIRCQAFHISRKSQFDIKSMAGNIIPAIATTNAVIAGQIVMEAVKILMGNFEACRTVYLTRKPNPRKRVLVPCQLNPPNPKCYVCAEKREVRIQLNLEKMTVHNFEEKILKGTLHMVAPDAEIDGGAGTIIISSEEGETDEIRPKMLSEVQIKDGSILAVDDFRQDYSLRIILFHVDKLDDDAEFKLLSGEDQIQTEGEAEKMEEEKSEAAADESAKDAAGRKRPAEPEVEPEVASEKPEVVKKARLDEEAAKAKEDDDGLVCLD